MRMDSNQRLVVQATELDGAARWGLRQGAPRIPAGLAIGILANVASAQEGTDSDGRLVRGALGERMAAWAEAAASTGFRGAVLAAKHGEVVVAVGVGSADLRDRVANTPNTLFEIASATKQFTGAATMRLVQDGRLALDDPLAKLLPGVPEDCQAITVEHLLRHTLDIPGTNSPTRSSLGPPTRTTSTTAVGCCSGPPAWRARASPETRLREDREERAVPGRTRGATPWATARRRAQAQEAGAVLVDPRLCLPTGLKGRLQPSSD